MPGTGKVGDWRILPSADMDITVSYNEPDDYHFQVLQKEAKHVVHGLLARLHKTHADIPNIQLVDIVLHFYEPFRALVLEKSNNGRIEADLLTAEDLDDVLIIKCFEVFYRERASVMLSSSDRLDYNPLVYRRGSREYMSLLRRIRVMQEPMDTKSTWEALSSTIDDISSVERLFCELFRFCFCLGTSILSLDDDKLRKLSSLFSLLGFKRTFTRDSGACPVMHMVVSIVTGLSLVTRLDRPGTILYYCTLESTPNLMFCVVAPFVFISHQPNSIPLRRPLSTSKIIEYIIRIIYKI